MTRERLRRLARWAEKIATAETQLAAELAEALTQAEASEDPLGRHSYQARARYRRISERDKSKAGKATERELEQSYAEAARLGFDGPFKLWTLVMQWGKSPERQCEAAAHPPCNR
jgi:hypothetical protein